MDRNYKDFVARMGSFDMDLDVSSTDELNHYGVLGMHWGKRKGIISNSNPLLRKKEKKVIVPSDDHVKKVEIRKKKMEEMSNAELKAVNERMQLEKTYKELSITQLSTGKRTAKRILNNVGQQQTTNLLNAAVKGGLESAGKRAVAKAAANVAAEEAAKAILKTGLKTFATAMI